MPKSPEETGRKLRQQAEKIIRDDRVLDSKPLSLDEAQKLIHELRVHQIELEMQNEELRSTQQEREVLQASLSENIANFTRSEHFKQTIIDSLPASIAVIDQSGLITAINKPWLHFGLGNDIADEMCISVGANYLEPCKKTFAGDDSDSETASAAFQGITSVLEGREPRFVMEYPCHSPAEKRWFQMSVVRPEAEVGGAVISHIDISNLKRLEEDRRSYILHLVEVIEQERSRTARELHDDIGQKLTCLSFEINQLKHDQPVKKKSQQALQNMQAGVDNMMLSVRRLCTNLRPALLDELGLSAALEWLCKDFSRLSGIPSHFTFDGHCCESNTECSITIFRIIQESLNNTIKHAGASKASISLCGKGGFLHVTVNDDGCGIASNKLLQNKSFGIIGMKERAHAIGAKLDITSKKGKGTSVCLVIPCKYQEEVTDEVFNCR